jgi:hypothetical protein
LRWHFTFPLLLEGMDRDELSLEDLLRTIAEVAHET